MWWLYIFLCRNVSVAQYWSKFKTQWQSRTYPHLKNTIQTLTHVNENCRRLLKATSEELKQITQDRKSVNSSRKTRWTSNAMTGRDVHKYCMNRQSSSSKQRRQYLVGKMGFFSAFDSKWPAWQRFATEHRLRKVSGWEKVLGVISQTLLNMLGCEKSRSLASQESG